MAMMTDSPAAVASRAARILLRMPPVPSTLLLPPAMSITLPSISGTVASNSASGCVAGSLAYRPSTLVSSTRSGACKRFVTIAARWSLSPKRISATLTVSFSLMMGKTPHSKQVTMVLRALR